MRSSRRTSLQGEEDEYGTHSEQEHTHSDADVGAGQSASSVGSSDEQYDDPVVATFTGDFEVGDEEQEEERVKSSRSLQEKQRMMALKTQGALGFVEGSSFNIQYRHNRLDVENDPEMTQLGSRSESEDGVDVGAEWSQERKPHHRERGYGWNVDAVEGGGGRGRESSMEDDEEEVAEQKYSPDSRNRRDSRRGSRRESRSPTNGESGNEGRRGSRRSGGMRGQSPRSESQRGRLKSNRNAPSDSETGDGTSEMDNTPPRTGGRSGGRSNGRRSPPPSGSGEKKHVKLLETERPERRLRRVSESGEDSLPPVPDSPYRLDQKSFEQMQRELGSSPRSRGHGSGSDSFDNAEMDWKLDRNKPMRELVRERRAHKNSIQWHEMWEKTAKDRKARVLLKMLASKIKQSAQTKENKEKLEFEFKLSRFLRHEFSGTDWKHKNADSNVLYNTELFDKARDMALAAADIDFSKYNLINPAGRFRLGWDCATALLLIYVAIYVPYQVGFLEGVEGGPSAWLKSPEWWWDRCVDMFFTTDMILVFFTAIKDEDGRTNTWITDKRIIGKKYLEFWFPIDLMSVIPFTLLFQDNSGGGSSLALLRILRLLKLAKLLRMLRAGRIMKRWRSYINLSNATSLYVKYLMYIIMLVHFFACGIAFVGTADGSALILSDDVEPKTETFIHSTNFDTHFEAYSMCMLWAISAISGSAVVFNPQEAWYGLLVVLVGTFFLAILIGEVANVAGQQGAADREYLIHMDTLNSYLEQSKTELSTGVKFREYFIENHVHYKKKQYQATLDELPDMYRAQARRDEYGPLVLRMLMDLFAPFLKVKYLSLFIEAEYETYQQRDRREKQEMRDKHNGTAPRRASLQGFGSLHNLMDYSHREPPPKKHAVSLKGVKKKGEKARNFLEDCFTWAFGNPNEGVENKEDILPDDLEAMKKLVGDSWHHFVASFREDERIACRIHELDEQAKRRFMVEKKESHRRGKVKLSIGKCWDDLRKYGKEEQSGGRLKHNASMLNIREIIHTGESSPAAASFLHDLKDLRMLEKTMQVGMRDMGREILHEMEIIIPDVAVALDSVLSIAGESIYEEDDMNDDLYIVVVGAVSLRDQESITVKGPGECFGDAVVMRLINDEPRKHMQNASALTNADMYKLCAQKFKTVIASGRSPTVYELAKRVAVRKTFKRMVPIIKNKLRYMNTSNEQLPIYIERPYLCSELGKRKNWFKLFGKYPTIAPDETFPVKRRTHKTMVLRDDDAGVEHSRGHDSAEVIIMDVKWYELADGRGWINDLTPSVLREITALSAHHSTVRIPYEKRTILIDPSSLLGREKEESPADGGGSGTSDGDDEGGESRGRAKWRHVQNSLSALTALTAEQLKNLHDRTSEMEARLSEKLAGATAQQRRDSIESQVNIPLDELHERLSGLELQLSNQFEEIKAHTDGIMSDQAQEIKAHTDSIMSDQVEELKALTDNLHLTTVATAVAAVQPPVHEQSDGGRDARPNGRPPSASSSLKSRESATLGRSTSNSRGASTARTQEDQLPPPAPAIRDVSQTQASSVRTPSRRQGYGGRLHQPTNASASRTRTPSRERGRTPSPGPQRSARRSSTPNGRGTSEPLDPETPQGVVVLPASGSGTPRDARERALRAMTEVARSARRNSNAKFAH